MAQLGHHFGPDWSTVSPQLLDELPRNLVHTLFLHRWLCWFLVMQNWSRSYQTELGFELYAKVPMLAQWHKTKLVNTVNIIPVKSQYLSIITVSMFACPCASYWVSIWWYEKGVVYSIKSPQNPVHSFIQSFSLIFRTIYFQVWLVDGLAAGSIKYFLMKQKYSKIMCEIRGWKPKSTSFFFIVCFIFCFGYFMEVWLRSWGVKPCKRTV